MRSILYIINPGSGTRNKKNLESYIEERTRAAGIPFERAYSVAGGDYRFLYPLIEEKKITDVVIAGGDGTVSQVIGSLLNLPLSFGIIPCGSGNGLALAAGISKDPAKAMDIVLKGEGSLTDGFYINDRFACMLCGLGFDARVAHDFAQQPKRGLGTYVKQVFRNFLGAKPYPFSIQLQNGSLETEALFLSIANSNQFGNHFTIAPKARLDDGLLDIVIATRQNKLSWILQTLRQISGKNKPVPESRIDGDQAVIYFQTEKLSIQNPSLAPLHIDGDPAETAAEINIQVNKGCFRMLRPGSPPGGNQAR